MSRILFFPGRLKFLSSPLLPAHQRGNTHPVLPTQENQQLPQQSRVSAPGCLRSAALSGFLLAKHHDVHLVYVLPVERFQGARREWQAGSAPTGPRLLLQCRQSTGCWGSNGARPPRAGPVSLQVEDGCFLGEQSRSHTPSPFYR